MERNAAARLSFSVALLGAGLLAGSTALTRGDTLAAADPFLNPGFEQWPGTAPSNWKIEGAGLTKAAGEGNPGNAVRFTPGGGTGTLAHQPVSVAPGARVFTSIEASGSNATVQVNLRFLAADLTTVFLSNGAAMPAGSGFATTSLNATAPPGVEYVSLEVTVDGVSGGFALLDNASLSIVDPEPSPTPSPTDTQTPTPEPEDTPTPTATTSVEATAPGGGTDTRTPTPTKTPTPTRTPTGTRTPSPTREPTATKTPNQKNPPTAKATNPLPTSTPTPRAGSGFGGMLANGDFEVVQDGRPAYWQKYGGTMFADGASAGGTYAACLQSETSSTKWIYQVVPIEGGQWYAGAAVGRVEGAGLASIRVSWYTTPDGAGSQLDPAESNLTASSSWAGLATGPIQAPPDAASAKFRLALQPDGSATACFDDASFVPTAPPEATPVPGDSPTPGAESPSPAHATPTPRGVITAPTTPGRVAVPLASFPEGGPGALRLSEVMSDPEPGGRDAPFEWVELVNISSEPVNLAGWKIADSSADQVLPSFEIPAGGYVVLAGTSAQFAPAVPVVRVPGGVIGNGLGNDGDYLGLLAPNGELGDEMSYGTNTNVFGPAPSAPEAGRTLGVLDPAAEPASENWRTTKQPTPGEPNLFAPPAAATPSSSIRSPLVLQPDTRSAVDDERSNGGWNPAWWVLSVVAATSFGLASARFGPGLAARVRHRWKTLR